MPDDADNASPFNLMWGTNPPAAVQLLSNVLLLSVPAIGVAGVR